MTKILSPISILILIGLVSLLACSPDQPKEPSELFATHCGSCHVPPNPADLPKGIWEKNILPEMAARLGIRLEGYDPYKSLTYDEQILLIKAQIYPYEPAISMEDWQKNRRFHPFASARYLV